MLKLLMFGMQRQKKLLPTNFLADAQAVAEVVADAQVHKPVVLPVNKKKGSCRIHFDEMQLPFTFFTVPTL